MKGNSKEDRIRTRASSQKLRQEASSEGQKILFSMMVTRHRHIQACLAGYSWSLWYLFLMIFKNHLDVFFGSGLVWVGIWDKNTPRGPFQYEPFYDSVISDISVICHSNTSNIDIFSWGIPFIPKAYSPSYSIF